MEIPTEPIIKKADKPLSTKVTTSKFSIKNILETKPEETLDAVSENSLKNLPANHFTETDLQNYWQKFLETIRNKDKLLHSAINIFKLKKLEENTIEIQYPSDYSKSQFDTVSTDFTNGFSHAVNNHSIEFNFVKILEIIKQESTSNRSKFEKLCEINPLLRELDEIFKFDLS